ncbi:hypothetical protein K1T35_13105 [Pseudonocardia sp. DSM 110487]|uniref:hypothetical protein n=1 Tax=Pseudonocardia sp. DSM 110487 TaxID=2865833 RepID=UPI001C69C1A9|nr:hypothetical protein [Pseudonocardia sp. DSM 110487]QYN38087.1 hypothetical protein K1T35_13105 [Pseudonocardia sp. DSM 110487]
MGRMVEITGSAAIERDSTERLERSLRELLATLIDRAFGLALDAVEGLARQLDEVAARGGLPLNALLGGAVALFEGRSPLWGAVRGAFAAMSPAAKGASIAALILALLLVPLTVVLLLLALIGLAVWGAIRAARR